MATLNRVASNYSALSPVPATPPVRGGAGREPAQTPPVRGEAQEARPSAVVNISSAGREQLARVQAAETRNEVSAVQQSAVATTATAALQERAADASQRDTQAQAASERQAAARSEAGESQRKDPVRAG